LPARVTISRTVFGHSVDGRPLVALALGPTVPVRLLVVGVIHGDESTGEPIVRALLGQWNPSARGGLVVVPELNPDGVVRRTRQNAHAVDLNRNFPYGWRTLGRPGDQQYSGRGPLSEPESRAMAELIRRFRPSVTVWFHQPLGIVDESGGSLAIEMRFARVLGEPLRRLSRYPGSATSWQNATFPGSTAFVVELPRRVSSALAARAVRALLDVAR
jgi:protein MpaA